MAKNKQSEKPDRPSLYGENEAPVGVFMETNKQYREARQLLLGKGMVTAEELAIMPDADVEETLDKYFAYVHSDDKTLVLVRRTEIPALENLIIRLDK